MTILWMVLGLIGLLLLIKLLYVAAAVAALPRTGGALFCTTQSAKIATILDALPIAPGGRVIDLGCGDGRFLRAAAGRYDCRAVGYEINLLALILARLRTLALRSRVKVRRQDFWTVSLAEADLVFCYLFPDLMERVAQKAARELKPGAVLVSCNFPLPGWHPEQILTAKAPAPQDPIYLYRQSAEACS